MNQRRGRKRHAWLLVPVAAVAALLALPGTAAAERVGVLVEFNSPPRAQDRAAVREADGRVEHVYGIVPVIAARLPARAIRGLERRGRVASVERDGVMRALDYRSTHDWGIAHIGADTLHANGATGTTAIGSDVRVAVADTGIDCDHIELASNCHLGPTFVSGTTSSADDEGHGTHVAGTIAAERNPAVETGVVGVAPTADVVAYKVLNSNGSGTWSNLIAAIDHIWNGGDPRAEVLNMSLGAELPRARARPRLRRWNPAGGRGGQLGELQGQQRQR